MLPNNFSFVLPGKLAGMAVPPLAPVPLLDTLIELGRQGVTAVISLTERSPPPEVFGQAGFRHRHIPVRDFRPPAPEQIAEAVEFVRAAWAEERAVAVHCAAGYGRTGTILAAILAAEGTPAEQAIATIRELRPGSIETSDQENAVRDYAATRAARQRV